MMAKVIAILSTSCLVLLLWLRWPELSRPSFDSLAVIKEVQQLNELVTVRYGIQKVVGMKEEKSPIGSESILLLVEGRVLAGIDLSKVKQSDIQMSGRDSVRICLPKPHIEDVYLDEKNTKVWDRCITWWTPWVTADMDLEHKARMRGLEEIKQAALEMNILAEAQRNAETDIRGLLGALGIKNVEFSFTL